MHIVAVHNNTCIVWYVVYSSKIIMYQRTFLILSGCEQCGCVGFRLIGVECFHDQLVQSEGGESGEMLPRLRLMSGVNGPHFLFGSNHNFSRWQVKVFFSGTLCMVSIANLPFPRSFVIV